MPKAVLFDLFGTLVHFQEQVPTVEIGGQPWRTTMRWLEPVVRQYLPRCPFESFLAALLQVTRELAAQRAPEYLEVPSVVRFRRALAALGIDEAQQAVIAPRLVEAHMARLASCTRPDPHATTVLRSLRNAGYALGVVSNFDHEPTALGILDKFGLRSLLDVVVISAGFGRRKPHPAIFRAAIEAVRTDAPATWFVGDNYEEDVRGARAVGLKVAWIRSDPSEPQARECEADVVQIATLAAVPELVVSGSVFAAGNPPIS